jgi:hypothetical protein
MIKQKDTKDYSERTLPIISQLNNFFSSWEEETEEFNKIWNEWFLEQSIDSHADYGGEWAGSGTLDYNEARVIYTLIKKLNPQKVLEIGVAQGISGALIKEALSATALFDGIDIKVPHRICKKYKEYLENDAISFYKGDAIEFVKNSEDEYDLIFVDADHRESFCTSLAKELKQKYPKATILYHEWSFSVNAKEEELKYVSRPEWIKQFWERKAFEDKYTETNYKHFGFYGSCGLGVVIDENLLSML